MAVIWGATGGYLVGFAIAGALVGRLAELGWDRRLGGALGAMLLGNVAIYLVGLPWLKVVTGMSVQDTVANGLTPFLVGDALEAGPGRRPVPGGVVDRRAAPGRPLGRAATRRRTGRPRRRVVHAAVKLLTGRQREDASLRAAASRPRR